MPRRKPGRSLERRGDGYRVRFQVGKERRSITIKTRDRRVAIALTDKRIRELQREGERRLAGLATGLRTSELLAMFERDELPALAEGTRVTYLDCIKPIRSYFIGELGDPTVESVRARHISEFLAWRRVHRLTKTDKDENAPPPAPVCNRTLRKDRAVLHRIFALADQHEYREGNPVARTEMPKADKRDPILGRGSNRFM